LPGAGSQGRAGKPGGKAAGAPGAADAIDWSSWEQAAWPERCLECENLFRQRHARLYFLLGRKVSTTRGPGWLLSAFQDEIQVALLSGPKGEVTFIKPWQVWPYAGPLTLEDLER
jgi:hypothetical protein